MLELAKVNLLDKKVETQGTLRLTVPSGLEESLIIPLLDEFKKEYPDICIKVLATGANLNFVEDGIDIALRVGELKDSNVIAHKLLEYTHILVASPEYLQTNKPPYEPKELKRHKVICGANWHNDTQWGFYNGKSRYKLDINESLSLNHYAAIQVAAEKGMGIAELPAVNCQESINKGYLVQILPNWRLSVYGCEHFKLSIVYTANRYNSTLIKNFKSFCIQYFRGDDEI